MPVTRKHKRKVSTSRRRRTHTRRSPLNTIENAPNFYTVYTSYTLPSSLSHSQLAFLGSGSYGSVYAIGPRYALKEHRLNPLDVASAGVETCADWQREYTLQKHIHSLCNDRLAAIGVSIAEPFRFSYARRTDTQLESVSSAADATSCFFTLERLPGRAPHSVCFEYTLATILKPTALAPLTPSRIPPYLYLGSIVPLQGHITLDMVQGARLIEFPNESFQYCEVDGVALAMQESAVRAFFMIIEAGYMPRDVEFVLNGTCAPIHTTVLDFNEVRSLEDRAHGRPSYILAQDIAHVYIDLCGLRASFEDVNPHAPYDSPTPQWKFLCSPLTSPNGFFACFAAVRTAGIGVDVDAVVEYIYEYVYRHYIRVAIAKLSGAYASVLQTWTPIPVFCLGCEDVPTPPVYRTFDTALQRYIIAGLLHTLALRQMPVPPRFTGGGDTLSFSDLISELRQALTSRTYTVEFDDAWDAMGLWGSSVGTRVP